jgi:hypothetical protein
VRRLGAWLCVGRFSVDEMWLMMFGRAFSQNGEIGRPRRVGGIGCYTDDIMSFMRWRQPHRSRHGVNRHISAQDVAAEQVLGNRTRARGDNRSRACQEDSQLLGFNGCALQPLHLRFYRVDLLTHRFNTLAMRVTSHPLGFS